jgi:hypothetical protein
MFNNKRYMARGISNDIPLELSIFLWSLIDDLKGKIELDYLKVFNLKNEPYKDKFKITITHSQEVPMYNKEHETFLAESIEGKIFVIDDESHSTMLWASEY